jgi:uncharacterized membrane protein YkoI
MKRVMLIISAAFLVGLTACGQQNATVPASVKSAFSKKFTNVSNVKWSQENNREWEAEFKKDGKNYSSNFDNSGNWKETEYAISMNEVPAVVTTSLKNEFEGYKVKESELSESEKGKLYEFMLKKGDTTMEVAIDPSGHVVKKEKADEDGEADED